MNPRMLIAVMMGLVLVAFGGFYFALKPRFSDALPPQPVPTLPPVQTAAPSGAVAPLVIAPPSPPPMATPASVEAEIALSEYAEILALLKKSLTADYDDLIAMAVRRRNEGVPDQVFGQELAERVQAIMRGKLKYGAGASIATIDRLAANEASLFHALGTEGALICLQMLGKDNTPTASTTPESVRRLMRLGTQYRFQAIAEGMANTRPVGDLTAEETRAFDASLVREGLNFKDVSTGAFLDKVSAEPGKPCLRLETLHLAISRLGEGTRRKIYAGMFFVGRDK